MSKITLTLILADIHHQVDQATKIIKHVGADEVICLGDIFDDFTEDPEIVKHSAEWYVDFINKPNHIMIMGNHEQHYAFTYRSFQCSGYEQWKYFLINDIVDRNTWDKVKWYHFLDNNWLLTHGGLHKFNVPESITKFKNDRQKFIEEISKHLDYNIQEGFKMGATGKSSWIFNTGHSRGGSQRVGGITWCDFEREFFPVQGINQIVGHTPQELGFPKWCCLLDKNEKVSYMPFNKYSPSLQRLNNPNLSTNICLDVYGNTHYGIWDGKKLSIGSINNM